MDVLCPGPLSRPRQKCRPPQSSGARLQHEPLAKACHLNCPIAPDNHSPRLANSNQRQNPHAQRSFSQLRNDPPQWGEVGRTLVTFGVIPAKAGIQYAAASRLIISDCGILDHPLSRMMTRECVATDFQTANCILAARCARV